MSLHLTLTQPGRLGTWYMFCFALFHVRRFGTRHSILVRDLKKLKNSFPCSPTADCDFYFSGFPTSLPQFSVAGGTPGATQTFSTASLLSRCVKRNIMGTSSELRLSSTSLVNWIVWTTLSQELAKLPHAVMREGNLANSWQSAPIKSLLGRSSFA